MSSPKYTSDNSLLFSNNKDTRFSDTLITKIRDLSIKNVVEKEGITLKNEGNSVKALCPFHDEKTASFSINEKKNMFKCFGCGESGDAIAFVMKKRNLTFQDAIKHIRNQFQIIDSGANNTLKIKADYEKVNPPGEWMFTKKDFTAKELSYLGPYVNDEICEKYNFYSCNFYVTPDGHKWKSNKKFPIFILDVGDWQKIYQPFADKSKRFIYINKQNQPNEYIYGLKQAKENASKSNDIFEVYLVCGEKDALNLASLGHSPLWLGSEAEELSCQQYSEILNIAATLYYIPDIDKAGKNYADKLALKFLDVKTIWLPDSLMNKIDERGYKCKDLSDFVSVFSYNGAKDISKIINSFNRLKYAAIPIRFWQFNDKGKCYIVNSRLYAFLQAQGFYKYECKSAKAGYRFIRIKNNIVSDYEAHNVVRFIHEYLENTYQNEDIRDAAYRSPQTRETSIANINTKEIDTKNYDKDHQYMYFQNEVWKVTKDGIEPCQIINLKNPVWEDKVQKIGCKVIEPFFKLRYTKEFLDLLAEYEKENNPEKKDFQKKEIHDFPEIDKYLLDIRENNFSFLKFLENTSNFYWQKVNNGEELTEDEMKENSLHLINKLFALGYLLCQYKEPSKPYAVIAIDGANVELGQHQGGTGKTIFAKSIYPLVSNVLIPAQSQKLTEDSFVFSQVTKDTDYVLVNDCHAVMDFHFFLNALEGDLTVNPKNINKYTIPYEDVPKFCFTTNNAIKGIDGSIMRRLLYVVFSDYYHSKGGKFNNEFNPSHEFGKSLFQDYTEEEWIETYNFFANCISLYLEFSHEKINPPMKQVDVRNLRQKVGEPFIEWAEDKFFENIRTLKLNPDMLEFNIGRDFLYENFKEEANYYSLNKADQNRYSSKGFKKCLMQFCGHYDIIMNPSDVVGFEEGSNRIRIYLDGKRQEVFYFRAANNNLDTNNLREDTGITPTDNDPF